ncbi:unnamed protein product [Polarella glacialis]|uniref:PARP catalytic domain-containing protein n=1 Tax=Polarella glacialis TaxID=89957 RepID=A0A813GDT2_POLGL|nr:unnamed protein product [Polarella glacialis]
MEARDRARISAGLEMLRYAKVAQMPEEEPATRTLVGLELQAAIDSSCELELKQALMSAQQYDRTSSPLYKRAREVLDAILEQKRVDQIARQLGEASSRGDLATVHALLQAGARTSGPLEKFAERPEFAQAKALLAKSVRQSLQKAVATCDRKAARQACSEAVRYGLCELPEYKRLVDLRKQLVLQNIEEAAARKEQENLRAKLQEAIEDPDLELEHLREEPGFRGGLKVYRDLLSLPPYFEDEQVLESVSKRHSVKREELLSDALCQAFQELMDKTYRKVRTKDRRGEIPKRLLVKEVLVVKNSSNFVEYLRRREEIRQQLETDKGVPPSVVVNDLNGTQACKTLANLARGQPFHSVWRDAQGVSADPIDTKINEFYLFHGTGPEAATAITEGDFRMDLAGSNAGTLYGRGIYFSESTGKSDEYSRQDSRGLCPVLVCRVTLGRILYTDEEYPDTRQLVRSCVAGNTHSVLGDREKIRNTFRELIVFDSDQAYPEFIVWYAREF